MSVVTPHPPAPTTGLLTAEEFVERYSDIDAELVRGRVQKSPMPAGARHGKVSLRAGHLLTVFVDTHDLGHLFGTDAAIVTARGLDTVRGADVCFVSYAKMPREAVPDGPITVPPDLVVDVRSPTDRWNQVLEKVLEYLAADIPVVVVLDPATRSASVFGRDVRQDVCENDGTLTLPDILPGFSVPVADFFR